MSLTIGKKLGPYEIMEQAGAGGMGEVYKAKDTRLDRTVAIKVLTGMVANNPDLRQRFDREAKAISSLNHPNICILYDVGEQDGQNFLVMEYLEGETLAGKLRNGSIGTDELLRYAIQIADALDKAHKKGLVHRDLKPGNVMITKDGAKLLDFGLAKLKVTGGVVEGISGITKSTPLTGAGTIIGTLQYMSPEQLEGKEADSRSDIFSFGAVLYEMATGNRAFQGSSQASLIGAIMKEEPRSISQLQPMSPPMLERTIKQCLEKDADNRWQSAGDLKRALQWISEGGSQIGIPVSVSKKRKLNDKLLIGISTLLFVGIAVLGTLYFKKVSEPVEVVRTNVLEPEGNEFSTFAGGGFAISPDGLKLVFTAHDSSGGDDFLWVRPLNSLTALKLPGTENPFFPFWSPDSRYIGFFVAGKLKKILASGGPSLSLCDAPAGRGGSWNKNDIILFAPDFEKSVIHKVAAAGGIATPVTVLDTAFKDYTHRWVEFLPDDKHFLYYARTQREAGGEQDAICLGSLETEETKRLFPAKSNMAFANGNILFMREGALMAQPFDASGLELAGDAIPIAENVSYLNDWHRGVFSASPSGHLVYRVGDVAQGSNLLIVDRQGQVLDTVGDQAPQYGPKVSHDGKFITIDISDQTGVNTNIWIHDIERGIKTKFTFGINTDRSPIWSPDDKQMIYASIATDSNRIYLKSVGGADSAKMLYQSAYQMFISDWSNNGQFVAFTHQTGKLDIWILPILSGGEPYPYLQTPFNEGQPVFSPDGRWLAYSSNETDKPEVYVAPFPNHTGKWQVSTNRGTRPRWSTDGTKIYYFDQKDKIMVADVDGKGASFKIGQVQPLFQFDNPFFTGRIFDVFPDGERFLLNVYPAGQSKSQAMLVQNWAEELK